MAKALAKLRQTNSSHIPKSTVYTTQNILCWQLCSL